MKIVEINTCDYGSTGKIMLGIAMVAREEGHTVYTFSRGWKNQKNSIQDNYYIGSFLENGLHHVLAFLTGFSECFSVFGTLALIRKLKKIKPDVIHLHNLHNWFICLPIIFNYIKKNSIPVVWTLHDCWAFTGHCPYYTIAKCDKWKTECYNCPQYKQYPHSFFDNSQNMFRLKKKWFTGVKDFTIVTPSYWLAGEVKQSFLKDYPVKVINNGIDLSIFKPTESNFREDHNIPKDKFVILGVAFGWGKRKGLDVFIELSKRLNDEYQIVLVGTNDEIDKQLPENIISIHRTQNQAELAEIYSGADLFVNPTREEVLGLVNIEALACGTPVVTFNSGGSPECIDSTCGIVVDCDDIEALEKGITEFKNKKNKQMPCMTRAKCYEYNTKFIDYVNIYKNLENIKSINDTHF